MLLRRALAVLLVAGLLVAAYEDNGAKGWWAAAQDTARKDRRWLLQVQAICMSGIEDQGGTALPAESFLPAGP